MTIVVAFFLGVAVGSVAVAIGVCIAWATITTLDWIDPETPF